MKIRAYVEVLEVCVLMTITAPGYTDDRGKHLFQERCAACHALSGFGTQTLFSRLGREAALLEKRTDLQAAYVRRIVRTGIRNMPPLTRIDVSDEEAGIIADYLDTEPYQ